MEQGHFSDPCPLYLTKTLGTWLWDMDGNEKMIFPALSAPCYLARIMHHFPRSLIGRSPRTECVFNRPSIRVGAAQT